MQHCSEVLVIIRAALDGDETKVRDYANLLADKLESDEEANQAKAIRNILSGVEQKMFGPS